MYYLRVRGEYIAHQRLGIFPAVLPPRARRIRKAWSETKNQKSTTSACAENTGVAARAASHTAYYLRVRGEYL